MGCISPWKWTKVPEDSLLKRKYHYGIEIKRPKDWYQKQFGLKMTYTQHGLLLDQIIIKKIKWNDTLSNNYPIPGNVLLNEIPEIVLGELYADSNAFNLDIHSNEIIFIDNLPCSIAKYSYYSPNNLQMRGILCCIPFNKMITLLSYRAEESYYYNKTYQDFLRIIQSINISDRKYLSLQGT